jgi:hypothetical protein
VAEAVLVVAARADATILGDRVFHLPRASCPALA